MASPLGIGPRRRGQSHHRRSDGRRCPACAPRRSHRTRSYCRAGTRKLAGPRRPSLAVADACRTPVLPFIAPLDIIPPGGARTSGGRGHVDRLTGCTHVARCFDPLVRRPERLGPGHRLGAAVRACAPAEAGQEHNRACGPFHRLPPNGDHDPDPTGRARHAWFGRECVASEDQFDHRAVRTLLKTGTPGLPASKVFQTDSSYACSPDPRPM